MEKTMFSYQCPNCEAPLSFDAAKQKFCCEYCGSDFEETILIDLEDIKRRKEAEENQESIVENREGEQFDNLEEYECPNCGAEVACEGNTATTFCVYCHTPVIHKGKLSGQFQPARIIPFRFDKEQAKEKLLQYSKKFHFIPKDFFSDDQMEYMQGVYYPFWLTDADTSGNLDAIGTKVRHWTSGNYSYTETSRYKVLRGGDIHFEDISTSAISDADKAMLEGILPYPSNELTPFSMAYLSGFLTEKRDIEASSLEGEVHEKMKGYSNQILKNTVSGYNSLKITHSNLHIRKEGWEYNLLPIWLMTYKGKDKNYVYAMNGCTGKVYGEFPINWKKVWGVAAAVLAGVAAIAGVILGGILL